MSAFVGMDVERVRTVAQGLDRQADVLDDVVSQVAHALRTIRMQALWEGADVDEVEAMWTVRYESACRGVVDGLRAAVTRLRRQADQQDAASGGSNDSRVGPRGLLELAGAAYDTDRGKVSTPTGSEWERVDDAALRALGIDPASLDTWLTGFQAGLYKDVHGNYVLSFAGTEGLGDLADVATDLHGSSGLSLQSAQAMALATALASSAIGSRLQFTGHSLGGRLAAVASIATGRPATTFNAAGLSDYEFAMALEARGQDGHLGAVIAKAATQADSLVRLATAPAWELHEAVQRVDATNRIDPFHAERRQFEGQITSITTSGDPLTNIQEASSAIPDAVGRDVDLQTASSVKGPIGAHNVEGIRASMPQDGP